METSEALARRMSFAFARWQALSYPEKPNQTDLGNRVGKRSGRTYTQTAVAGWLSGKAPRELDSMDALAVELDVDPGWLYFNRGTAPTGWEEALRRFPPANTPEKRITKSARKTRRKAAGE